MLLKRGHPFFTSSHLSQPLDKGIFGTLKVFWRQVCHQFLVKNPGAWVQALTPRNIVLHNRREPTCLYCHQVTMRADAKPCTKQKTSIAYIPLYTPANFSHCVCKPKILEREHKNFGKCYETGANSDNSRYQMWLQIYHPNSALLSGSPLSDLPLPDSPFPEFYQPALKHSSIDHFLDCLNPPLQRPAVTEQHSLWVLTSSENLKELKKKKSQENLVRRKNKERQKKRKL